MKTNMNNEIKKERTFGTLAPFIIVGILLLKLLKGLVLIPGYYLLKLITLGKYPKE
ncbi:hypothetical protein ACFPOG_12815 [Paenibacillus aestuarii]|uniref:Uncharacterized protein n=1 Tax=Paenibacillus aestuarii TaxID=516965 RepID=A0ABW0K8W9_9BACL